MLNFHFTCFFHETIEHVDCDAAHVIFLPHRIDLHRCSLDSQTHPCWSWMPGLHHKQLLSSHIQLIIVIFTEVFFSGLQGHCDFGFFFPGWQHPHSTFPNPLPPSYFLSPTLIHTHQVVEPVTLKTISMDLPVLCLPNLPLPTICIFAAYSLSSFKYLRYLFKYLIIKYLNHSYLNKCLEICLPKMDFLILLLSIYASLTISFTDKG